MTFHTSPYFDQFVRYTEHNDLSLISEVNILIIQEF